MTPQQERKIIKALSEELQQQREDIVKDRIIFLVETFFTSAPQVPFNRIQGRIDKENRVHIEVSQ